MKHLKSFFLILMVFITTFGFVSCGRNAYDDKNKIPVTGLSSEEIEGAAGVERDGDVINSPYYVTLDFFNMKSSKTLTILENFKTYQQTTEWTCGPASILMVMEYLGVRGDYNDIMLADLREKPRGGATNLRQMINIFDNFSAAESVNFNLYTTYELEELDRDVIRNGDRSEAVYTSNAIEENYLLNNLKNGIPTIIGWDDWGGHYTVVIGYDTLGTETTADDILIIADPYDTTDHCQDGYVIQSFERLYYNWKNTFDPVFKNNVFLTVSLAD